MSPWKSDMDTCRTIYTFPFFFQKRASAAAIPVAATGPPTASKASSRVATH